MLEYLLPLEPALVHVANKDGFQASHMAASRGKLRALEVVVTHGCDITARTKHGENILQLASHKGGLTVARLGIY